MQYEIALYPGDGIGAEIVDAAVPIIEALGEKHRFEIETTRYDWGADHYLEHGILIPEDAPDRLAETDAILHGATGHPKIPEHQIAEPDGHLRIRNELDQYLNIRPAILFDGVQSPLRGYNGGDIDIKWYRENSEGGYINIGGQLERANETELAIQSTVFTKKGIARTVREAFKAASDRSGSITNVTKSNAQKHAPVFWDEVVEEVAEEYPDVSVGHMFVDAAALHLAQQPEAFDVVVAPNLFSDILTDLTAALVGGLGVAPSANLNPEDDDVPGMFEPVHGSAPDIAGQGLANPLAIILSVAMMLDDLDETQAAQELHDAVAAQLRDETAPRTPDLGGDGTTTDVAEDLKRRIRS